MPRITLLTAATAALVTSAAHAAILSGPVVNPANNHTYYLLTQNTWTASEAEAVTLGGHLVTVNNAAEDAFVFGTFGGTSNPDRFLWIGLTDVAVEDQFVWIDGDPSTYRNWYPGEPSNSGGLEDYGNILAFNNLPPNGPTLGRWNDFIDLNSAQLPTQFTIHGVVEVVPEPATLAAITAAGLLAVRRRK